MATQYLLVKFPQDCTVMADGSGVGATNKVLMLPAGEYLITLDASSYAPANQDVVLIGTSQIRPMVISFQLPSPSAAPAN